jgi:hypothetical protein
MLNSSLTAFSSNMLQAFAISSRRLASVASPLAPTVMFPALPRLPTPRRPNPLVVLMAQLVVAVEVGPGLSRRAGASVRQAIELQRSRRQVV